MTTSILVLYHADCPDGWTAAWAAWRRLGDVDVEYKPIKHTDTVDPDVAYREVYVLDFCFPREKLLELKSKASSMLVLDHHKSNEANCQGLDFCKFDMTSSGAGMAWDYFHPNTARPMLINYIEDRDIWRWSYHRSRTVSASLSSYPLEDFRAWTKLADRMDLNIGSIIAEGEAIERVRQLMIDIDKKHSMLRSFAGHNMVPVVNASGMLISDVLNQLASDNYFAVGWHQGSDGRYKYSLRSKGDFDVAAICERFGGGGHKNAAAFVSDLLPWQLSAIPF